LIVFDTGDQLIAVVKRDLLYRTDESLVEGPFSKRDVCFVAGVIRTGDGSKVAKFSANSRINEEIATIRKTGEKLIQEQACSQIV
jgi:hypothetical protein